MQLLDDVRSQIRDHDYSASDTNAVSIQNPFKPRSNEVTSYEDDEDNFVLGDFLDKLTNKMTSTTTSTTTTSTTTTPTTTTTVSAQSIFDQFFSKLIKKVGVVASAEKDEDAEQIEEITGEEEEDHEFEPKNFRVKKSKGIYQASQLQTTHSYWQPFDEKIGPDNRIVEGELSNSTPFAKFME